MKNSRTNAALLFLGIVPLNTLLYSLSAHQSLYIDPCLTGLAYHSAVFDLLQNTVQFVRKSYKKCQKLVVIQIWRFTRKAVGCG